MDTTHINLSSFKHPINALIFGASGGLGEAFLNILSQSTFVSNVVAVSRSRARYSYENSTWIQADFGNEEGIANTAKMIKEKYTYFDIIIVATGIYMGLDINEMYVKILVDSGKIRDFDLTFYYLERL